MHKFLSILVIFSAPAWAVYNTTCIKMAIGPAILNACPPGYDVISNGDCCDRDYITSTANCFDQIDETGHNNCEKNKNYCNTDGYTKEMHEQCRKTCGLCTPSSTCADLKNPNTGRSGCHANKALCNDKTVKEAMKLKCPKTCGYCK
ncbi:hypothetical protein GCK72_006744 [Caenorhabditis remanei]|uniref:ShKT domain-containing protein n=1 Tax=Caenorhabditis remanei TaxID=31234 RepID=A0A6A5HJC7_CAERE|nr:hypothetical protein GCK72_006744 [Caenorhabditis remanei]KAF1766786.1 hypothetical protein GCK72_006744 [Caenorhabditis remanei]